MGSIMGHRIDYDGVGLLRGQRHISTQKSIPVLPAGRSAVKRSTDCACPTMVEIIVTFNIAQGQNIRLPLPVHLKVSNHDIKFLFCI